MRKVLLAFIIVLLSVTAMAQNEPVWVKRTPKPSNNTFFYRDIKGYGDDFDKALENAKLHVKQVVSEYMGDIFEIVVTDDRVTYKSRDGQSYWLPYYRVCEWQNSDHEWIFLYQIAKKGVINPKFDHFDCHKTAREIYWRAGVESLFIPGLGQIIDKKQYVKGTCFFAGTAACVIGGLVANNNYQWYIDLAGKTLPGPTHSSYMDSADQWNKIEIGCFIAAGLCWVANVCDALFANPKNYNVSANVGDKSMTLSLNVKF